jgi:1-acyl-sn-glycerol-3-phosphate acyltransferase
VAQQDGGGMSTGEYRPARVRSLVLPMVLVTISLLFAFLTCVFVPISRRLAHIMPRTWAGLWLWSGGVRIQTAGLEKLDLSKRYVFVSNHQSGLDIPVLYRALRDFRLSFMSKKELMMIPLFGWGMAMIGHIAVDRGNARKAHESISRAVNRMRRGRNSLVVFPEGTRSPDGLLRPFKTGVFNLALEMGVEMVPVALKNTCRVLPKSSWVYRPGQVTVMFGKPIPVDGLTRADKHDVAQRLHGAIAEMLGPEHVHNAETATH